MEDPSSQAVTVPLTAEQQGAAAMPSKVGPYLLKRPLGHGGMGEVWLAAQTAPVRRDVALKLIRPGMDTAHVLARFEAERQALAVMEHPAIAKVFDGGAGDDGRPYFVMEYVQGEPISTYCSQHRLNVTERLSLFLHVCEGVQHAHQKGIIHRDLKPSNILVSQIDGAAAPKIIDFGVAKAIADPLVDTLHTQIGSVIGTPEYMSPEQTESRLDIDTRADVYALGVILYELLSGVLPFDWAALRGKSLDEVCRIIRELDPPRPSDRLTALTTTVATPVETPSTARELRGDLDWITMRALEKDRERRYGSVADFAADIRRYIAHVPVIARPPSAAYRAQKFVRRHRLGVAIAASLTIMLIASAGGTAYQARRIARERDRANQAAATAQAISEFLQRDLLMQAGASLQASGTRPDPNITVRTALDRAAARVAEKFGTQPAVEADIRQTIGVTYRELGLYDEAQRQIERALELRRSLLGEDHPDTAMTAVDLGDLYNLRGQYDEAERVLARTLRRSIELRGESDAVSMRAASGLENTYFLSGDYSKAEPLARQNVALALKKSGEDGADTLMARDSLASIYYQRGQYAEAEPLFEAVVAAQRRLRGDDHAVTLNAMNNLAMAHRGTGHIAEAERLFVDVLEARRRVLTSDHPDTLISANNLASLYVLEGKFADGEKLYREAAEGRRRVLGDLHPDTLSALTSVGAACLKQKKYGDAEAPLRAALAGVEKVIPNDWPRFRVQALLGAAIAGQRRYAEAERLLIAAYEGLMQRIDRVPAPNRPGIAEAAQALADMYDAQGKKDLAAEWRAKSQAR